MILSSAPKTKNQNGFHERTIELVCDHGVTVNRQDQHLDLGRLAIHGSFGRIRRPLDEEDFDAYLATSCFHWIPTVYLFSASEMMITKKTDPTMSLMHDSSFDL